VQRPADQRPGASERGADHPHEDDGVFRITGTARSHTDDQNDRITRYVISMSIRVACVVLALFVDGWLMWVAIAGAVVLPYVAVVLANAGREQPEETPATVVLRDQRPALPRGSEGP